MQCLFVARLRHFTKICSVFFWGCQDHLASRIDISNHAGDPRYLLSRLEVVLPYSPVSLTLGDALADEILTRSPSLIDVDARRIAAALFTTANANHLDPLLVLALMHEESGFDFEALSPVGASGLLQLMPATSNYLSASRDLFDPYFVERDPVINVVFGIDYLAELRTQFGSWDVALTAYNRGPNVVRHLLEQGPLERSLLNTFAVPVLRRFQRLKKTLRY